MYSVVASLVPRRLSVESEVGRELDWKPTHLALVRDGVSCCQRTGDPVGSACPGSIQPVFRQCFPGWFSDPALSREEGRSGGGAGAAEAVYEWSGSRMDPLLIEQARSSAREGRSC